MPSLSPAASHRTLLQGPLPRQLVALGLAEPGAADDAVRHRSAGEGPSLAERLAPWLSWTDAIALAGVLDAAPPAAAPAPRAAAAHRDAAAARATTHAALTQAIDADRPDGIDAHEWAATTAPGARYRAHQQAMDARLGPLRAKVRAALAARSPALGRVALLDRLFEQALAGRERQLLSAVPTWLDRRLQREPAAPESVVRPLLQAELAHRMQPIDGMLAALDAEAGR